MKSELSAEHYCFAEIFQKEQKNLFRKYWIFACFSTALLEDRAFVARVIGGVPIFLQKVQGEIKAFKNQCPHRMMPIVHAEFGVGKSVCPYHGWVFEGGKLKTIPKADELYGFSDCEKNKLCLQEFHVEVIGNFVFVNLSELPFPITEQFSGEIIRKITDLSPFMGASGVHLNIHAEYNWKLNFENIMDFNHVPYVHPVSFQPHLLKQPKRSSSHPEEARTLQDLSYFSTASMQPEKLKWHEQVEIYQRDDTYQFLVLFPNVNFFVMRGVCFSMQQFCPLSENKTQLRVTLQLAKQKTKINAVPAILRAFMRSEFNVISEDVILMEKMQSHLSAGPEQAQHGKYESRLYSFGKFYKKIIEGRGH